jgi:proline iminopeptidase
MDYSKMTDADWKYPPTSGDLTVSEDPKHVMHWEEYGNPNGEPVIFIHGGPGGGIDAQCARLFDPARYRVIMYDQRGCGDSRPHITEDLAGALAGNITANLVEDIQTLRIDRGITDKAHIFGGSWGSTLAMSYAQAHPEHVQDLILRGIFLCNKVDLGFFYQGNADTYATQPNDMSKPGAYRACRTSGEYTIPPELRDERMVAAYDKAWHNYVSIIPQGERSDMIAAYNRILTSPDVSPDRKQEAALGWSVWEGVTSYLNQDVSDLGKFKEPTCALACATIENEYFYRSLRGEDRALSELMASHNIATLASLPIYIIQGAHDQVCVPSSAHALKQALEAAGPVHLDYRETVAGHSMKERTTNAELTSILDHLPRIQQHATRLGRSGREVK